MTSPPLIVRLVGYGALLQVWGPDSGGDVVELRLKSDPATNDTGATFIKLEANGEPGEDELPQGETGLILVKSPNVFPGYVDQQATQKVFTPDGWLNTGDLGFMDAEGRLHLNGRAKDLIIRSGHNIDPKMIEEVLARHPDVALCAAVGAPDTYAGEVPVAFVTLNNSGAVTEAELLAFAAENVNEIPAKPKVVTVLDVMPLTNVGKIYKPELRRLAAALVNDAKLGH